MRPNVTRWAILTGEYPPQSGGVSDYTRLVAEGLAAVGDEVAVYAPPQGNGPDSAPPGVRVRRLPDRFGLRGLRWLDRELVRCRPDRVLIQYVPHAFGLKAMNLPFAAWVAARARRVAPVWVMFHEVAFPFVRRPLRHNLLAVVNRVMARAIAGAADRVLVSIPSWGQLLSQDLPASPAGRVAAGPLQCGHRSRPRGGRYGPLPPRPGSGRPAGRALRDVRAVITDLLEPAVVGLLRTDPLARVLLIGRGSERYHSPYRRGPPGPGRASDRDRGTTPGRSGSPLAGLRPPPPAVPGRSQLPADERDGRAGQPGPGRHQPRGPVRAALGGVDRGSGRPGSRPRRTHRRGGRGPRPPARKPACIGCSRSGTVFQRVYPRADHRSAPQPWVHTRRPDFWLDPSWRTPLRPPISTWRTGRKASSSPVRRDGEQCPTTSQF